MQTCTLCPCLAFFFHIPHGCLFIFLSLTCDPAWLLWTTASPRPPCLSPVGCRVSPEIGPFHPSIHPEIGRPFWTARASCSSGCSVGAQLKGSRCILKASLTRQGLPFRRTRSHGVGCFCFAKVQIQILECQGLMFKVQDS